MRYVVTGAAGFIGSHLLRALLERGHDATGWDAFTDYYDPALKEENARGLPVERLDLVDGVLDLEGVDGVFHLAGQPGVRSFGSVFPTYVRQNVLASQRLFEAAVAAGARTVLASSSSIYGDAASFPTPEDTVARPLSPYGITKLACEHLISAYAREFGLGAVTLRYFTIYGPRQRPDMALARMVACVAEGRPFELFGDGTQSRSFT
ncbi:MAG: NAD-dependent epimerase/dehydratase family protein, partial [Gaiellaceae bacterium]